jgi:hypothetical protein
MSLLSHRSNWFIEPRQSVWILIGSDPDPVSWLDDCIRAPGLSGYRCFIWINQRALIQSSNQETESGSDLIGAADLIWLARLDESIAAFNQRFIFPPPFAMKIIKINLWNQGMQKVEKKVEKKVVQKLNTILYKVSNVRKLIAIQTNY